jgi:acyl-CoA thioesterase I
MIIMRRIILALCAFTLTSCDVGSGGDHARDVVPDPATSGAAATAPSRDAADRGAAARDAADGGAALDARGNGRPGARRTILFVGTSLTAGYGVGEDLAYPAVLQQKIDAAGLPFRVVNAGISGETSAGGLRRIDWSLQQPVDVLVLELGANDGLRGLDPDAMRRNLDEILTRARDRYPDIAIVILGMEAPPNLGSAYTGRFRRVYADLARKYDAALVPFLLDGVAGQAELNIADGIHPSAAGHQIVAGTVWPVLEPVLAVRARAGGS